MCNLSTEVKEGRKGKEEGKEEKERKERKEKKGKKRKEAKEGKEEGPTTGTRARVAWVRAAREPGRQGSQWAPPWCEVTDRGKTREAVGKIEKKEGYGVEKGNTPCGTGAHNLRIRGPTPCPLGQGGSNETSWQEGNSSG